MILKMIKVKENYNNCTECVGFNYYNSTVNVNVNGTFFIDERKSDGERILEITQLINTVFCSLIVLIGIIGNLLTCCVFNYKSNKNNDSKNSKAKERINPSRLSSKTSIKSSKSYILALAFSDLLFLISHLLEDIFPNMANIFKIDSKILKIVDNNDFLCKITLYLRNATRISSSYLVVLFALERLMICSYPLKRLRFHYKNFNRNITIIVFLVSFILTCYTPVLSGLRVVESYEESETVKTFSTTCDTKKDFLNAYFPITLTYVLVQIIIPSIAICYLNFNIIKVLMTRKSCVVRSNFKSMRSPTISHESGGIIIENNNCSINPLKNSSKNDVHFNSIASSSSRSNSIVQVAIMSSEKDSGLTSCIKKKNRNLRSKSQSVDFSKAFNQLMLPKVEKTENSPRIYKNGKPQAINSDISSVDQNITDHKYFHSNYPILTMLNNLKAPKSNNKREFSQTSSNLNTRESDSFCSSIHAHTQDNSCWIFRHSRLFFKLKKASRATSILVLISFVYVILNVPYAISWLCFFIPAQKDWIEKETRRKIFGVVYILEIFHISNYCINFFLYCISSRVIRSELKLMLLITFRTLMCKKNLCQKFKNRIFNKNQNGLIDEVNRFQNRRQLCVHYDDPCSGVCGTLVDQNRKIINKNNVRIIQEISSVQFSGNDD